MADQQDPTTGAWNLGYYPVTSTAFAVLKLAHHAVGEVCSEIIDPFDPAYEYSDEIEAGLRYIFENAACIDINTEPAGNPDVNLVNGKGIYFLSPGTDRPLYETGIVMMALKASCHPERIVDAPGSCVHGWTYLDVMRDTVDYIAWAQNDEPNVGRGGWRYGAYDDGTMVSPGFGAPDSDNSLSQWPVLGLLSAAEWGANAPGWVRSELLNYWLAYSQDATTGCFGYAAPDSFANGPFAVTAAGLIQLTYCGVTTDDSRWAAAANCICTNWDNKNIGNIYAMYGLMKAAMLARPETVWSFCGHEWHAEYDAWLLNAQNTDGSWNADGYYADQTLATEWALLILQKIAPEPPELCGPETISASDVRVPCGSTDWTTVSVDTLPDGLSGYIINLTLDPTGCARFTGNIGFINPGAAGHVDSVSDYSITFRDTDFGSVVQPGATDVDLAQVEIECLAADPCGCEATIHIQVNRFEDESGALANPCIDDGLVTCGGACPTVLFPDPVGPIDVVGPSQDLDGDGDCEDINGDGNVGFVDAILLSYNVGSGDSNNPINLCPSCFDFCCNDPVLCGSPCDGAVGFVDAICHAWTEVGAHAFMSFSPRDCTTTVNATDVDLDGIGSQGNTTVHVDNLPDGLSGYIITLTLAPEGVVKFTGDVNFLSPGAAGHVDAFSDYSITFRDTDFGSVVQAGASDIDLAEVTLEGIDCSPPEVTIHVQVDRLEEDDGDVLTPCVVNATAQVTCSGDCTTICTTLTPPGWQMLSIPGDLCGECAEGGSGNLCCAICDDLDPCFIFRFDPDIGGYVMVPPCEAIDYEVGMGFWTRTYEDLVEVCADVTPITTTRCIPLPVGWNQIGNPFTFEVSLDDVTVRYGGNEASLGQAQANGWVSMYLFGYDPASGGYVMVYPPDGVLQPWGGYWIRAYVDCEVCIPPAPAPPSPPMSALVRPVDLNLRDIPTPPPLPDALSKAEEVLASELRVVNVPNPVRSEHTTTFRVEGKAANLVQAIRVDIYDQRGQLVFTQEIAAKELAWHTVNDAGELLANGVYLYQVWVKIGDTWYPTGIHKLAVYR